MLRSTPILGLLLLSCAASLPAQSATYEPNYATPEGPELLGIFISSYDCGGGQVEGLKEAVEELKLILARRAQEEGSNFRMIGIAVGWEVAASIEYFADFGAFDELVVGSNWFNVGAQRFLWADTTTKSTIPQVQVFRQQVGFPTPRRVEFSDSEPLIRVLGSTEIIEWVSEGAPFSSEREAL